MRADDNANKKLTLKQGAIAEREQLSPDTPVTSTLRQGTRTLISAIEQFSEKTNTEEFSAFTEQKLRPQVFYLVGISHTSFYAALSLVYAMGVFLSHLSDLERLSVLRTMRWKVRKKTIYLDLLANLWPKPRDQTKRERVRRKYSRYAAALRQAEHRKLAPAALLEHLHTNGGVQSLAEPSRTARRVRVKSRKPPHLGALTIISPIKVPEPKPEFKKKPKAKRRSKGDKHIGKRTTGRNFDPQSYSTVGVKLALRGRLAKLEGTHIALVNTHGGREQARIVRFIKPSKKSFKNVGEFERAISKLVDTLR